MTSTVQTPVTAVDTDREGRVRLVCGTAAAAAVAPFALATFPGDTGADITTGITDNAGVLQVATMVAVFAAAGLILAAVRLGDLVGGTTGRVVTAAGSAVALLLGAYYATFGAAAIVGTQLLSDPGPGLGESAALLLNTVELTRYAPGLVLVVAAVVARGSLPRGVWISAAVLAIATAFPLTSWVAAVVIPVWLGIAAVVTRRR